MRLLYKHLVIVRQRLAQLKILQEAITLTVFVPFAIFYLKEPLKLDYLWAGLCILGAVICQGSCHVTQAAFFTVLSSWRIGLSQTVSGRSQFRVAPRQRSG